MHVEGIGTAVDPKKAASILARRPVKDDAEMAFLIGSFYDGNLYIDEDQRPVFTWYLSRAAFPEDKVEAYLDTVDRYNEANRAREWYLKGAQGDHLGAQYSLATLYFRGHEPPDWDCGEGMKWLRRAADGGDGIAQFNMGWIYLRGMDRKEVVIGVQVAQASDGVEVKSVTASGPAARSGLRAGDVVVKVDSRMRLGSVSSGPLKVEEFAERIGKGKGEAIALEVRRPGRDATLTLEVTPREIVIECPGAKAAGLMVDPAEAFRWFQKAAETGNISGLFYVATAYRDGKGVGKDTVKAVELFEKGSARGDWQAALALYEIYAGGNGVEKDKTRAEEWYRKALDLKHRSVGTR
jgi:TPR repeat protein